MRQTIISCLILLLIGCNQQKDNLTKVLTLNENGVPQYNAVQSAGIKMITVDGKYKVWTKRIGDGDIKVLLLHGGPAATHDYFECFEDFLPQAGIEFYYYDQLGCGNSDIPSDTSLWNLPRFVEEVEQVRQGLGLNNFYLYGQSWGSLLAMEYLQKYQSHVKAAILSNMTAGTKSYLDYAVNKLKPQIFTQQEIKKFDSLDRLQQYNSPLYQELLMSKLYPQVLCRLADWPEPLMRTFRKINAPIYIQMQGVDEFHVTGNLKHWEMWDRLPNIKIPTLVIGGEKDEMNPEDMRREGKLIPNSRTYLCPNGSHMSMWDDQQNYFNNLIAFLKDVEENQFKPDAK
jgi:proline iminopeptidase